MFNFFMCGKSVCGKSVCARNKRFNQWLFHSLTMHSVLWTRDGANLKKNGIVISPLGEVYYDGVEIKMNWRYRRRLRKIHRCHITTEAMANSNRTVDTNAYQ